MTAARVAGHTLVREGTPYGLDGCCAAWFNQGHGLCSCGAKGEHEVSTAGRKRWHRRHKADVQNARP